MGNAPGVEPSHGGDLTVGALDECADLASVSGFGVHLGVWDCSASVDCRRVMFSWFCLVLSVKNFVTRGHGFGWAWQHWVVSWAQWSQRTFPSLMVL